MSDLLFFLFAIFFGILIGGLLGYCLALIHAKKYMEEIDKRGGL